MAKASKFKLKVFDVCVFEPIRLKQLKHVCKRHFVLAGSPIEAERAVREKCDFGGDCFIKADELLEYDGANALVLNSWNISLYTKEQVAKPRGLAPKPKKAEPTPKLSDKPLGGIQISALSSLNKRGVYPGGWQWDTPSGTVRILESLRLRGLVSVKDGKYRITKTGIAALDDHKIKEN